MNIKDLIIRNKESQTLKELQSWTVKWTVVTDYYHTGIKTTFHKVFIVKKEADGFVELLDEFHKITKSWIDISIKEN